MSSEIKKKIEKGQAIFSNQIAKKAINACLDSDTGYTPLHSAVAFRRPSIVDEFLKHPNLNINVVDNDGLKSQELATKVKDHINKIFQIRNLLDILPEPVKHLLSEKINQNPPQIDENLNNQLSENANGLH